jgi:hypothetical protein
MQKYIKGDCLEHYHHSSIMYLPVWIVHTSKSESFAFDLWEDFVAKYPWYKGNTCRFVNLTLGLPPSQSPKLMLLVFEDAESLNEVTEKRLDDLLKLWHVSEMTVQVMEPREHWRIPECTSKMFLAAMFPLRIWWCGWEKSLEQMIKQRL